MNKDIEDILNQYNDVELAFFASYRLKTYLPETQKQIKDHLKTQGLSQKRIEKIVTEIEFNPTLYRDEPHCPRCYSTRFFKKEDIQHVDAGNRYVHDPNSYRMDVEIKEISCCEICGYELNKGFRDKGSIIRYLKNLFHSSDK